MASQSKYNFVVFAPNDWFGPWMNRQHIFSEIGKQHNVIYTRGAWWSWEAKQRSFYHNRLFGQFLPVDQVLVARPPLFMLRNMRNRFFDVLALRLFARFIKRKLDADKPVVLYLFHPAYAIYADFLEHDLCVYHAYDDYSRQSRFTVNTEETEDALLARADIAFAVSTNLRDKLQQRTGREVQYIPNAVNYEVFGQPVSSVPEALQAIPGPKVGYTGRINSKLDLNLLLELATARPALSFVFVGEVDNIDDAQKTTLASLRRLTNVYFVGHKPLHELPAYMHAMDVNLMCYRVDGQTWAGSIYPLKMHEYLAVGKPVLSSNIASVREHSDVIEIVDSVESWLQKIDHYTLAAGDNRELVEKRKRVAADNQWSKRVADIIAAISGYPAKGDKENKRETVNAAQKSECSQ